MFHHVKSLAMPNPTKAKHPKAKLFGVTLFRDHPHTSYK